MLSVNAYPAEYVTASRARFAALLNAYRHLTDGASDDRGVNTADFEPRFIGSVIVSLDASFVHRLRAQEGKDGNPLNEVRMLAASILTNDGILAPNTTIKYVAEHSVAKIGIGQPVNPTIDALEALIVAVHDEIQTRYSE
ncbi:hypothetical protein BH10ACT2_BH10ACT2_25000 [soil metagenome]